MIGHEGRIDSHLGTPAPLLTRLCCSQRVGSEDSTRLPVYTCALSAKKRRRDVLPGVFYLAVANDWCWTNVGIEEVDTDFLKKGRPITRSNRNFEKL